MAQLSNTALFNDASLVSYYKLENTSDSKGANTLTNHNSVTFTTAKYGNGANLGSGNTTLYLSSSSNMGLGTGSFSIVCWVQILSQPANGNNFAIVSVEINNPGGANTGLRLILYYQAAGGGTKSVQFDRSKPGVADQGPMFNVDLGTSIFHHLAFTYDGANIHGYVDGVDQTGASAASGTGNTSITDTTFIGRDGITAGPGGNEYASATIDDVGIFSRALTASEVAQLFQDGGGAFLFNMI